MSAKHTPGQHETLDRALARLQGPTHWYVEDRDERLVILAPGFDGEIATIELDSAVDAAQRKDLVVCGDRIVACVNACEGIADPSVVPELIALVREVLGARNGTTRGMLSNLLRTSPSWIRSARAAISKAEGKP